MHSPNRDTDMLLTGRASPDHARRARGAPTRQSARNGDARHTVRTRVLLCQVLDGEHPAWTTDLVRALADARPDVELSLIAPRPLAVPRTVARLDGAPARGATGRVGKRLEYLRRMRWADREARRRGADRLLFLDFETTSAAAFVTTRARGGPPASLFVHNHTQRAVRYRVERALLRVIAGARGAALVPHTQVERAMLERLGVMRGGACDVVPYALHDFPTPGARASDGAATGIVLVGPARPDKEPAVLGALLRELHARHPALLERLPLTIAGPGWSEHLPSDLPVRLAERSLAPDDFARTLAGARWILVPYGRAHAYCGSGVLHDAIAAGRPALVSDLPVTRDIATRYADLHVAELFADADAFCAAYARAASEDDAAWRARVDACVEYARRLRGEVAHALDALVRPPA